MTKDRLEELARRFGDGLFPIEWADHDFGQASELVMTYRGFDGQYFQIFQAPCLDKDGEYLAKTWYLIQVGKMVDEEFVHDYDLDHVIYGPRGLRDFILDTMNLSEMR